MERNESFVDIQGIRTHIISLGVGPATVVLLHGGGVDCASLSWDLLLAETASAYRVVAFDWPGYGESGRLDRTCSIRFLVDFLETLLDTLAIEKASLVGISMGGAAALGFTLRCPERVKKLLLVDSYGLQRKTAFHAFSYLFVKLPGINQLTWAMMRNPAMVRWSLSALLSHPGSVTAELVQQALAEVLRPGAGLAWTSFQNDEMTWSGTRTCYLDRLGEIRIPTLIIHGTRDSAVPPECAREAHVRIHDSQLHWMDGCGHWPQRDNPAEFNRVVNNFLTS